MVKFSKIGSIVFDALQENEIVQGVILGLIFAFVVIVIILCAPELAK